MKYLFSLFITIGTFFLVINCNTNTKSTKINSDFKVIASGAYGGISTLSQKLVSDETEYNQLFSALYKNQFPADFPPYSSGKSYIFITFGEKNSGGLDYDVKQIENNKNNIKIILKSLHKDTGQPMIATMAISNPYIVIEINKTGNKSIELVKE